MIYILLVSNVIMMNLLYLFILFQTIDEQSLKMKLLRSNNIFESFRFCLFCNKLNGYLFFTVIEDSEKFSCKTTILDITIFLTSLLFTSVASITVLQAPLVLSSRSIIVEIADFLFSKFLVLHPVITILLNFHFRHQWFQILHTIHKVDKKVKLI